MAISSMSHHDTIFKIKCHGVTFTFHGILLILSLIYYYLLNDKTIFKDKKEIFQVFDLFFKCHGVTFVMVWHLLYCDIYLPGSSIRGLYMYYSFIIRSRQSKVSLKCPPRNMSWCDICHGVTKAYISNILFSTNDYFHSRYIIYQKQS